ncbi:hypothetical protein QM098_22650 [Enterobacter hormaechei]|nr:hypothetical protein [Enterobacter hormaechei]MDV5254068.1 hypothetical protein [Enterobacter hormaechei]MDV5402953.1 hypothetical protein [Enterobacter hormaechei]
MLPTERRQVLQQRVINGMAVATQRVRSPFQIGVSLDIENYCTLGSFFDHQ